MIDWRIQKVQTTVSTNDDAKAAAEKGEAEGHVVWALSQTGGRGRHGRQWQSPEGNLYCSILLRPKAEIQDFGKFSFVAANAVYDTVRQSLPVADITLKWPNDVLVEGHKIAGILIEVAGDALIVGIGLNVMHCPEETLYPATSLLAEGSGPRKLDDVLDMLLQNIGYWYGVMQQDGFDPVRAFWLKHALTGRMSVKLTHGIIEGDFVGMGPDGSLKLRLPDGVENSIATGDVFIANAGLS